MCNGLGGLGHLNVPVRACSFVTKSFFRYPNKKFRCPQARGHVTFRALYIISAASRNFEKGARSRRHFQKVRQPEYFWATHPFNAKDPFNIYLCITILQEAFISIITNFLFLKNIFQIQKNYYNRFLPFLLRLSREKKS